MIIPVFKQGKLPDLVQFFDMVIWNMSCCTGADGKVIRVAYLQSHYDV